MLSDYLFGDRMVFGVVWKSLSLGFHQSQKHGFGCKYIVWEMISRNTSRGFYYREQWGSVPVRTLWEIVMSHWQMRKQVFTPKSHPAIVEGDFWAVTLQHFLPAHIEVEHHLGSFHGWFPSNGPMASFISLPGDALWPQHCLLWGKGCGGRVHRYCWGVSIYLWPG